MLLSWTENTMASGTVVPNLPHRLETSADDNVSKIRGKEFAAEQEILERLESLASLLLAVLGSKRRKDTKMMAGQPTREGHFSVYVPIHTDFGHLCPRFGP
jgi:hypothetical protein